jgi:hypothetical protein
MEIPVKWRAGIGVAKRKSLGTRPQRGYKIKEILNWREEK